MRTRTRVTHTVSVLELSKRAYDEIAAKLREAGYDQAFMDTGGLIDMGGIAVQCQQDGLPMATGERDDLKP